MSEKNANNSEMFKLGMILALYAAVSCSVLALVNNFTSQKIAQNQENKINLSMKSFFPDDDISFEVLADSGVKDTGSVKVDSVIIARKNGEVVGGASQVTGPTYDQGTVLVGMDSEGIVKGVKFLKLSDSPGFGLNASDPTYTLPSGKTFYGQFEGKNAKDGFITGETFDAISGATITSDGVANLLNIGTQVLFNNFNNLKTVQGESNE